MTIELAQPHTSSKSGAASKAADSRFKTGHGKSQPDALGGFQSILSAAADASSETVSAGATLLQAANDSVTKDLKDSKSLPIQTDDDLAFAQNSLQDVKLSSSNEQDNLADASNSTISASAEIAAVMPPAWMQSPLVANAASTNTSVSDTAASEQVNALLSQSRFLPNNPANVPPSLSPQSSLIQPQQGQGISFKPSASTAPTPDVSINKISNDGLKSAEGFGGVQNLLQASPALSPKSDNVQAATVLPLTTNNTTAISVESVQPPAVSNIPLSVNLGSANSATVSASLPSALNSKPSLAESTPSTRSAAPLAQDKTTLASVVSASLNAVGLSKEGIAAVPSKTSANGAPDASAQMWQAMTALPTAQSIQPITSVANQEMKSTEAAKVATIQVSTPATFARLGAQEAQDRPARVNGFNEFKPWVPSSFTSSSRMSDASSSGSGKDSGAGANASANPIQLAGLVPQPMLSELKLNQWADVAPSIAPNADSMVATTVTTEREVLREEHAIFKSNQPDIVPDLQIYAPTGSDNAFSLPTSDGAVPMETYVAEQVTYWVNQNVQNAELKLEGIGMDPVQVNITMQGNEAFVTFTTNEQQARDALENARQQLQDMLQSQGVILSGLSVGSNGAGNSGSQERNPRQGSKQTVVASLQPAEQEIKPKAGRSSGSALDLFV